MTNVRAKSRSATRQAVFDAAEHIIQSKGVSAATIAEIAKHARVSVGAVYTVFASREDLIHRVLYRALDEFIDNFVIPMDSAPENMPPINRAYAIERLAQEHVGSGGRHIARLTCIAYSVSYHDAAILKAVSFLEGSLERWFSKWCSAYFGEPPDNPNVRGEVRLCCDVVRGGRLRVATVAIQSPQAA